MDINYPFDRQIAYLNNLCRIFLENTLNFYFYSKFILILLNFAE
jgi:hypothetical protein